MHTGEPSAVDRLIVAACTQHQEGADCFIIVLLTGLGTPSSSPVWRCLSCPMRCLQQPAAWADYMLQWPSSPAWLVGTVFAVVCVLPAGVWQPAW